MEVSDEEGNLGEIQSQKCQNQQDILNFISCIYEGVKVKAINLVRLIFLNIYSC